MTPSIPLSVVLVGLGLLGTSNGYKVKYQDCQKPLRIQKFNALKICEESSEEKGETEHYNLIQPKREIQMSGYRCSVKKSSHLIYCGAFSHNKLLRPPTVDVPRRTTPDACRQLVSSKRFIVPGQTTELHVEMDTENVIAVDEIGTIHTEGNVFCEGATMKINGNLVENVVELSQYRILLTKEKFIVTNGNSVEAVNDHIKLPPSCDVGSRGCETHTGTFIWNPPQDRCLYELIRSDGKFEKEGDYLVDHRLKLRVKITSDALMTNNCPTGTIYYTENPGLMLTKVEGYPKMMPSDVDIFLYTDSRSDYLQYNIEKSRMNLKKFVKSTACSSEYTKMQNEIFALGDHQALRRGDVIYVFSCREKVGNIIAGEQCYDHIAIEGGQFVDPVTKVMTLHATPVECNKEFPLVIQTEGQGWVSITSVIKPISSPMEMHIDQASEEHESMLGEGVFTKEEERAWLSIADYGFFKKAILDKFTQGVCRTDGPCVLESAPGLASYNLENLIDREIKELSGYQKFNEWVTKNVGWLCIAVLFIWAAQMLFCLGIFVQTLITRGIGASAAALYVLCCTGPYAFRRQMRRARSTLAPIGREHEMESLKQPTAPA